MTTMLITGANKGLGREAARRLIAEGHDVWMAARHPELGRVAADEIGGRFVQLDVTDDASVAAAVRTVHDAGTGLDVLINNAGIAGATASVPETSADDLAEVYETNVFGLVRVTQAFLPLLEKSENPVIVNVSSGLGSLAVTNNPDRVEGSFTALAYPSSKAAVTMLTSQYARTLPGFRINAVDPGYTATDLNGHSGPQTVTEGTDAIVALAQVGPDGPTNTFADRHGDVPW
ncbi:SDR family NAD(P)-dependent oxidoreductase [Frankia sp. Cpl3]|nr:SDR family NAD(P)-dependent oxidoreductase [Frankia sp. Cpl3]